MTSAARRNRLVTAATGTVTAVAMVALAPPASAAPGEIVVASTSDAGVKANDVSFLASLSDDGGTVAFYSYANNLDPADVDEGADVYVKDLASGDVVLASASDAGVNGNGESHSSALSGDGDAVAFLSSATNLDPADPDTSYDVYVKDLVTGDIVLASTSDTGVKADEASALPSLSADGATVAFYSAASNLDPADTDQISDVYVKDLASGDIVLASTSDTGVKGDGDSFGGSLSSDGTTVAFWSNATNLDPADTDPIRDVYVKDLATGDIVLASTSDTGVKSNWDSSVPSLSGDGTAVAFVSYATTLDPADTDGETDVYVKDLATGDIVLASTSDAGVKADGRGSSAPSLSADGAKVAFQSYASNLDPADPDTQVDVYVKDVVTGDIVLASTSDNGVKGNGFSGGPSLSGDGASVGFYSYASNLDPADSDTQPDAFVKDVAAAPVVTMRIRNRARDEGDTGVTKLRLRVTLSAASAGTVTVDYATSDLSAVAGSDYTARAGTLTFAPGTTTKHIAVDVLGDTVVEPTERFRVTLSNVSGAILVDGAATGRILDDDA